MEENKTVEETDNKLENIEFIDEEVTVVEPVKKKKSIGKIIANILTILLFVVIFLEAAIGIIDLQKVNKDEEPVWYISSKKVETDKKTMTIYNLGLYKIVKTDTSRETKTSLKPFFLED